MSMSKKLKISLGLFGAFLIILLIIPFFINLNNYKNVIIEQAKAQIGRDIKIEGDISLFLIPQPKITINKVTLLDESGAEYPEILRFESATVTVNWLSLFSKKISVPSIELVKPVVQLHTDKNGKNNWDFLIEEKDTKTSEPAKETKESAKETKEKAIQVDKQDKAFDVALSKIVIVDGQFTYHNKEQKNKLDKVNLQLKADSLKGPFYANGSVFVLDKLLKLNADIGSIEAADGTSVKTSLSYDGHTIDVEGTLKLALQEFSGIVTGEIDGLKFNPSSPINGMFHVKAPVTADPKNVFIKGFVIASRGETLKGDIEFDIASQNLKTSLVGLPGKVNLKAHSTVTAQRGMIDLKIVEPHKLLTWLKIDGKSIPADLIRKDLIFKVDYALENNGIRLDNLTLTSGDKQLRGHVNWQDPKIIFDLQAPRCDSWLELLGTKIKGTGGSLLLKGHIVNDQQIMTFKINGKALETTFDTNGTFQANTQKFDLKAQASHNNLNHFLQTLGYPQNDLVLGSMDLSTHTSGTLQAINIHNLNLRLKPKSELPIDIKGQVKLGPIKTLKLNAEIGHVRLDEIQKNSVKSTAIDAGQSEPMPENPTRATKKPQAKWSHDKIDFSFLNQWQADIHLTVKRISNPKLDIRKLVMPIKVGKGQLSSTMNGSFFKGKMDGALTLTHKSPATLNLLFNVKDASMEDVLRSYELGQLKGGKMSIDFNATATGASTHALMHSLAGHLKIKASGGHLAGGLFNFAKGLDLGGILRLGEKKKKDDIINLSADIPISNGVMTLKKVKLETPIGLGDSTGEINLGRWSLDTVTTIDASELGVSGNVVVKAYGSLDDPKTDFKMPIISPDILRQGGVNTVKNTVDAIIPGTGALLDKIPGLGTPQGKREKKRKNKQKKPNKGKKHSKKGPKIQDFISGF